MTTARPQPPRPRPRRPPRPCSTPWATWCSSPTVPATSPGAARRSATCSAGPPTSWSARPITDLVRRRPRPRRRGRALCATPSPTPGARRPGRCTFVTADGDRLRIEHVVTNRLGSGDLDAVVVAGRVLADGEPSGRRGRGRTVGVGAPAGHQRPDLRRRSATGRSPTPARRAATCSAARHATSPATRSPTWCTPDDRPLLQTLLGDGHPHRAPAVLRFEHVDGTLRHVRIELAAVRGGSDVVDTIGDLVVTGTDVTERRQVQDLLADQASVLERIARGAPLDETLDAVARLLSHRLDQVGVVIGYGDQRGGWHDRTLNVVARGRRPSWTGPPSSGRHVSEGGFDGRPPRSILRSPGWSRRRPGRHRQQRAGLLGARPRHRVRVGSSAGSSCC